MEKSLCGNDKTVEYYFQYRESGTMLTAEDRYKKNIKQCYLVHPSSVLKFTVNKILRLLSKKAEAKLHTISTLSELQTFLPLRDIKITQDVLE
jgi:Zn-finger protein